MRVFNRRRTSKAPYARHSFTPSTPPAAARIADGFPLSAVGRPRRHGLRSRCFTASQRQAASLHGPFPSVNARQNRDEYPCACLCPAVPARPHACLSENRFHKRKCSASSERAPQTSAGGKAPLSPAWRLRSARYNHAFPLSRRNTVSDTMLSNKWE